ncbi:hypothetical protein [Aneurinibacillus terranovensis]|uniref:hypothetical protein n=1 Tax=Aneurinibacillus terranovensis TaxID=278991 RepID=UPI00041AE126
MGTLAPQDIRGYEHKPVQNAFSHLADRIFAAAPQRGGRKEEGSILGGLGDFFNGDD